ncbi:MAG: ribonuclease P protein component [Mycoplasmataceae bacterium]|jgi:ribonuclease P protein component|nr:ribonuclease P protein component [Mycoplasmataceae bacterium]
MKSKIQSLKSPKDFRNVLNHCKEFSNPVFKIKLVSNKLNKLRYGLAVNKTNFKKAVTRNKVKRQMRTFISTLKPLKAIDMIIVVKANYINNTYQANKKMFTQLYDTIK